MVTNDARITVLNGLPKESIGAEVGVYKGDYSDAILSIVKPRELHLIDPWEFQNEEKYADSWYGGNEGGDQAHMDSIYHSVKTRFSDQIKKGIVQIHRLPSSSAAAAFMDDYFDWVYIDGNHLYEYVKSDLENYYQKLRVGGYLACDDYGTPGWWENGVLRAVHEFLGTHNCRVAFAAAAQIVIQKIA